MSKVAFLGDFGEQAFADTPAVRGVTVNAAEFELLHAPEKQ